MLPFMIPENSQVLAQLPSDIISMESAASNRFISLAWTILVPFPKNEYLFVLIDFL